MNDDARADPDKLLEAIQRQEGQQKRGQLKIFLGMAAGVGKTYAMLEAARKQLSLGVDVVAGYVETHGRKETDALTQGLPSLPRKQIEHRGVMLSEMDVDAVLARKPQLALVDELAHTNAPGSRHPKRYQDILELLDAGIDVYTSLNVQHVESRAHTVEEITGSTMHETVPDSILDRADIELIDISPDDLMRRLDEGKVYMPDRAAVAMVNFFREGNLTALREMALRLAAERVGQDVRDYLQVMQIQGPWKTGHRLLVAVSASPLSAQMVRWTRRLADSLDAKWMAVHVESSKLLVEADQERLTKNLALARELGAEVIATADEDVVRGVLRVARQHNATQIVVGKPARAGFLQFFRGGWSLRRLVEESGDIDIHVVRADKNDTPAQTPMFRVPVFETWKQYALALGVVVATTIVNAFLDSYTSIGYRALALDYLLAVVALALFVGRGPILLCATTSALVWDFFFLPPRYTFSITTIEDGMMFGTYFVVAVVMGQLIARFRTQEKAERRREERTTALYLLTRELADAVTLDEIVKVVVRQIGQSFKAEVAVLQSDANNQLSAEPNAGSTLKLSEKESSVAAWVFRHNQRAGQFTDNLPLSEALYLPLATPSGVLGVIGVRLSQPTPPNLEQSNLLDAFVRQAALVIDRQRLHDAAQQSRLAAESERLSKTLLDSISHEMRTPIAAITSATAALNEADLAKQPVLAATLVNEVREAVARLNRLVGNILDITRVESGHVKPKMDWCDVSDLINVTVKSVQKELAGHKLEIKLSQEMPLVRMDFVLMEQALANLLLNAAFHTPAGTPAQISAKVQQGELVLSVSDRGPGIPPEAIAKIFEKFYRAPGALTGGTGLGLSIVKGFVEAQGGQVQAENQPDGGAAFAIPPAGHGTAGSVHRRASMSQERANPIALVIDDEVQMRRLLRLSLESNGYRVFEAVNGQSGLAEAAQRRPEIVVLDLGLPDMDGVAVLKRLREWSNVPVIVLSVRDREEDKIAALDNGADDYLTKPFSTGELLARLRVAQRHAQPSPDTAVFQTGNLEVDLTSRTVKVKGKQIKLTATEYALLQLFVRHAGKVLTHGQILKEVWGPTYVEQTHYLRVYMTHLREKIEEHPSEPELLITESGVGYRLMLQA